MNLKAFGFLLVFIFTVVTITMMVYGYFYIQSRSKEINANWKDYRCEPYVMPFAGWLVGPKGNSTMDNFKFCTMNVVETMLHDILNPYNTVMKLIHSILSGLVNDIQNIRKMIAYVRSSIEEMGEDIYRKLYDTYSRIAYLYVKIVRIFTTLFKLFESVFEALEFMVLSIQTLWNGPAGSVVCFFCFAGESQVDMLSGQKRIDQIKLGERTASGAEIYSIMEIDATGVPIYDYRGIKVSGSHLVLEKGNWVRVEDSDLAVPVEDIDLLYCLETSDSLIEIDGITFTDYFETRDPLVNGMIQNSMIDYLNDGIRAFRRTSNPEIGYGFFHNTPILMDDGGYVNVSDLEIGDMTLGGQVLVKIESISPDVEWYRYNGIVATGNTLVQMPDGTWSVFRHVGEYLGGRRKYHNVVTEEGVLDCGGLICTDFEQVKDHELNEMVDGLVNTVL